jgi:sigma-54 dependent transcriptional regulator, acetoin dehydrogenase operon transcriptional activator AcoR
VKVPALRERSDVLTMARVAMTRELGASPPTLDDEVQQLLLQSAWPGNVRQLSNVLRTACVMAHGEPVLRRKHLPDDFVDECLAHAAAAAGDAGGGQGAQDGATKRSLLGASEAGASGTSRAIGGVQQSLGAIEIDAIRAALDACGGNISEASKRLGISRNTIYRRLRWNEPKV